MDNVETTQYQSPNLLWMKLAIAVAVIRSKPPSTTAKEHAEQLRNQFFLVQSRLQGGSSSAKGEEQRASANKVICRGSHMTPPPSSETVASLSEPRVLPNFSQQDEHSQENMMFMRSLIAMQNIATQTCTEDYQNVHTTAVTHLQTLRTVLQRGLVRLSEARHCQAAQAITVALATHPWLEDHPPVMQEVCSFVEQLIHTLAWEPTDFGQYPTHQKKHSLVSMLQVFIRDGPLPLALSIVEQLIESLETFCGALRQSQATGQLISADWFQNSYFTLQCIEFTVGQWQTGCPIHPSLLQELQARLEACLVDIADRFPLITQAVWRVTSLIETGLQNKNFTGS